MEGMHVRLSRLLLLLFAASAGSALAAVPASAEQTLTVSGRGFGHGVGLSQWGAQGCALHGWGYRRILGHYYTGTKLGRGPAAARVRVLLPTEGPSVTFAGATRAGSRALSATTTYTARMSGRSVLLKGGGRSVKIAPRTRISGPAPLQVGVLGRYRGTLELSQGDGGSLRVVNAVLVEEYLRGVVAQEAWASWRADALKAQAVVARTYALTVKKPGVGFDQFADTRSQAYGGVAAETAATDRAIAATRRQVVTYRGRTVPTYFHSSSGGRTENAEVGFQGGVAQPWLVGVDDPYDAVGGGRLGNTLHRWTRTFARSRAEALLRSRVPGTLEGSLVAIRVVEAGSSGRIVRADVVGSDGTTSITGQDLAFAFDLPSSAATFALS